MEEVERAGLRSAVLSLPPTPIFDFDQLRLAGSVASLAEADVAGQGFEDSAVGPGSRSSPGNTMQAVHPGRRVDLRVIYLGDAIN